MLKNIQVAEQKIREITFVMFRPLACDFIVIKP